MVLAFLTRNTILFFWKILKQFMVRTKFPSPLFVLTSTRFSSFPTLKNALYGLLLILTLLVDSLFSNEVIFNFFKILSHNLEYFYYQPNFWLKKGVGSVIVLDLLPVVILFRLLYTTMDLNWSHVIPLKRFMVFQQYLSLLKIFKMLESHNVL